MIKRFKGSLKLHLLAVGIISSLFFISSLFPIFAKNVAAENVTYTYDNLNRLIQVVYEDETTVDYTYDDSGNRLNKRVTHSQAGDRTGISPQFCQNFQNLIFIPPQLAIDYLSPFSRKHPFSLGNTESKTAQTYF